MAGPNSLKTRCEKALSDGQFRESVEDFHPREGQLQMTGIIAEAMENGRNTVVEAGTGVGKTFAYLTPAVLSNKRVLIAVGTRYLQHQVYENLKAVQNALGDESEIGMLKGFENYLCLDRLDRHASESGDLYEPDNKDFIAGVKQWAGKTASGDISEFGDESDAALRDLTVSSENCLRSQCPRHKDCFVRHARERTRDCRVVVTNHHVLFANLKTGGGRLLSGIDAIMIDEAHNLPDTAATILSIQVSSRQISNLLKDVRACKAYNHSKNLQEAAGMLARAFQELKNELREVSSADAGGEKEFKDPDVRRAADEVSAALETLDNTLDDLSAHDKDERAEHCIQRLDAVKNDYNTMMSPAEENDEQVRWYTIKAGRVDCYSTPLRVAPQFQAKSGEHEAVWIYTSATLSVAGNFDYFKRRLGLECEDATVESPFDYARQSALYTPALPPPGDDGHTRAFVDECKKLIDKTAGGALLLFTSNKALYEAAEYFADYDDKRTLVQGEMSKSELVKQFMAEPCVLLGVYTFWEGVDLRGSRLRLVAINKLPFEPPNHPLSDKREQWCKENGKDYFMDVCVPAAVIKLRQGVGRLIRDKDDHGVVLIGDSRIRTKAYGKIFLRSLPPMKEYNEINKLNPYLQE